VEWQVEDERSALDYEQLADRIVEAIARRSEQDPGMTLEQVQSLLVTRVRAESEALSIPPRTLMGYVWRAWERHNRPPMLGPSEVSRVMRRLEEKGLVRLVETADAQPHLIWTGVTGQDLSNRLADLDHEERLFVRAIIRHLVSRQQPRP
jgi:hypothetical protein